MNFSLSRPEKELIDDKIDSTNNTFIGNITTTTVNSDSSIDNKYMEDKQTIEIGDVMNSTTTEAIRIKEITTTPTYTISSNIHKITIGKLHNQTIEIPIDLTTQLINETLKGQVKLTAQYIVKSSYEVRFDHNFDMCDTLKELDTSFFRCNGSYNTVQADKVCDKYNDCDDCHCDNVTCDCSAGNGKDEDEAFCHGDLKTVTNALLISFAIFTVVGMMFFVGARRGGMTVDYVLPHRSRTFSQDFKSITIELIENLKSITKHQEQGQVTYNWNTNASFVLKLDKYCVKSDNKKCILNVLITLSQCPNFEKACFELLDLLYIMECKRLGNAQIALSSLASYKGKDSYISAWILEVHERHGFLYQLKQKLPKMSIDILFNKKDESNESSGCCSKSNRTLMTPIHFERPCSNVNTKVIGYYISLLTSFILSFVKIGVFYFDIVKDGAALYFFYHLSYNILFLTGYETRYASVGEINFERLFYYLSAVVIISEILIYLRIYSRRKDFPRLFGCKENDTKMNIAIGIFPLHSVILEKLFVEYKIKTANQQIKDMFQTNNDDEKSLSESHKEFLQLVMEIEHLKHRLFYLNQLHTEIEIIESIFERELQLVAQTTLFLLAIYYTRILLYFDELFGIQIHHVFAINWVWTIISISRTTLAYRNSKRFPMTPSFLGTLLQHLAVAIYVSGKVVFVSAALSSYPYLHPIGHIMKMIVIYLLYATYSKCQTKDLFDVVVSTTTSACFFRPSFTSPSEQNTDLEEEGNEEFNSNRGKNEDAKSCSDQGNVDNDVQSESTRKSESSTRTKLAPKIFSRYGGIICILSFEILSGIIYTAIGFIIRKFRQKHKIKIEELTLSSAFEKKLLPILETFFIDVKKKYLIIGVICVPLMYIIIKFLYYQFSHPKKNLMNNSDDEDMTKKCKETLNKARKEYPDLMKRTEESESNLEQNNDLKTSESHREYPTKSTNRAAQTIIEVNSDINESTDLEN